MNDKPILSICIPTYNRADYLKECLDSVVAQFDGREIRDNVEVVISDNASPDKTRELVEEYQQKFNNIKYFRNNENFGFDLNVINVVENANGEYCWYMGDDDMIGGNSLKFIIDFLRKYDVAAFTFSSAPLEEIDRFAENKILESAVIQVNLPNEFLERGYCPGIFSVLGFRRDLWLAALDKNDITVGWLYHEVILKMIPHAKSRFIYFNYPIVFTRKNDSERVQNGVELFYWIRLIKMFTKMKGCGYKQKIMDIAIKNHAKSLPLMLCRAKGHDLDCSISNLRLLYKEFYKSPVYLRLYLFLAVFIFFIPNKIIKIIRDVRKEIYVAK